MLLILGRNNDLEELDEEDSGLKCAWGVPRSPLGPENRKEKERNRVQGRGRRIGDEKQQGPREVLNGREAKTLAEGGSHSQC